MADHIGVCCEACLFGERETGSTTSRVKAEMHHLASLLSLSLVAACASSSAPLGTPTHRAPTTKYTLQPLAIRGGEGLHSTTQSRNGVTGTLELRGTTATLALEMTTWIGQVRCPDIGPDGIQPRCSSDDIKDTRTTSQLVLPGTTHMADGALVIELRGEPDTSYRPTPQPREMTLTCRESFIGLACAVTDRYGLFGKGAVSSITDVEFATPGTKRYALGPIDATDVGRVTGTIDVTGGVIAVALAVDGGTPTVLPGTLTNHVGVLAFWATTSPTRTFSANCKAGPAALACELAVDRSVLGKPQHVTGSTVLTPMR